MIIDGKEVSKEVKDNLKKLILDKNIKSKLVVIIVGDNPASKIYVRNKVRACEYVGISSEVIEYADDISGNVLLEKIDELNHDDTVNGILVQLPLPKHIDEEKVLLKIDAKKDVDGFHPMNVGKMVIGMKAPKPCTPYGIEKLLDYYGIEVEGKHVVVVGRSNIVGKPIASLLLARNATVTIVHSKTADIRKYTKMADILVVAVGIAKFVDDSFVSSNTVIIDVGMNRLESGQLCGDVDFDAVADKAAFITPVPGGVGPMTIAMLLQNCIDLTIGD